MFNIDLFLSICLATSGLLALFAAGLLVLKRSATEPIEPVELLPSLVCAGPLAKLDYFDSLDPLRFAEAAEAEALAHAKRHLQGYVADTATLTLETLQQLASRTEMTVSATGNAAKALKSGAGFIQRHKSTNRRLPLVGAKKAKGVTKGTPIGLMKEVGHGRKALAGAAAASSIVVSAAHIISAADLARTLRLVDEKLDLLIAYRRIDQSSALERIYSAARELLLNPLDKATRLELWRLRGELRELRITWRRELEHHLLKIENPADSSWIDRVFTSQSSTDTRIKGKISDGQLQLMMVEYSLRLDCVLAAASDTWESSAVTILDELKSIARVGILLKEKASFISTKQRASAVPMIEGLEAIVSQYRELMRPTVVQNPEQLLTI